VFLGYKSQLLKLMKLPEGQLGLNIEQEIKRNELLKISLDLDDCATAMWELTDPVDILNLYKRYFPEQYAASTASSLPLVDYREINPNADPDQFVWGFSARELEFFKLVDRHLFPIEADWLEDMALSGERITDIPVTRMLSYSDDFEYEMDDLEAGRLISLVLCGLVGLERALEVDGFHDAWAGILEDRLEEGEGPAYRAFCRTLKQICEDLDRSSPGHPVAGLFDLLCAMHKDTDTAFIDQYDEMQQDSYYWTVESIETLREQFLVADAICDRVINLEKAFVGEFDDITGEVSPYFYLEKAVEIWNQAVTWAHSAQVILAV
jgi:hypothetical protein